MQQGHPKTRSSVSGNVCIRDSARSKPRPHGYTRHKTLDVCVKIQPSGTFFPAQHDSGGLASFSRCNTCPETRPTTLFVHRHRSLDRRLHSCRQGALRLVRRFSFETALSLEAASLSRTRLSFDLDTSVARGCEKAETFLSASGSRLEPIRPTYLCSLHTSPIVPRRAAFATFRSVSSRDRRRPPPSHASITETSPALDSTVLQHPSPQSGSHN